MAMSKNLLVFFISFDLFVAMYQKCGGPRSLEQSSDLGSIDPRWPVFPYGAFKTHPEVGFYLEFKNLEKIHFFLHI